METINPEFNATNDSIREEDEANSKLVVELSQAAIMRLAIKSAGESAL